MIYHIANQTRKTVGAYSFCGKWFDWEHYAYRKESVWKDGDRLCKTCVKAKHYWDKIAGLKED